jgi:hypothetical protein
MSWLLTRKFWTCRSYCGRLISTLNTRKVIIIIITIINNNNIIIIENYKETRNLYKKLLKRTQHVKVWISYAKFEASLTDGQARIFYCFYYYLLLLLLITFRSSSPFSI